MTTSFRNGSPDQPVELAAGLAVARVDGVAVVSVARPQKRNALDDETVRGLGAFFAAPPTWAHAVVLTGAGPHFCAGLDLGELSATSTFDGVRHSMMWHRAFEAIESGALPVVAALHGAVIGGGLELALAAHVRVADETTFYALPEGQHGLFVGGGASVRLPRLVGVHRMTDLMLTGRRLDAMEGQQLGISTYLTEPGAGLDTAVGLAIRIAGNAPITNFAVLHALPRIAEAPPSTGYLMEALMSAVAQDSDDAKDRMSAFLTGRIAGEMTTTPQELELARPAEGADGSSTCRVRPVARGGWSRPSRRVRRAVGLVDQIVGGLLAGHLGLLQGELQR